MRTDHPDGAAPDRAPPDTAPPDTAPPDTAPPDAALPDRVRDWLAQPALSRLWDGVHARLQRNGRTATGRLRLPGLTDAEREALSLLLGRPLRPDGTTVDLAGLDAALRSSAAARGLLDVAEALRGPVVDRQGRRHERAAAWQATWSAAARSLEATGLARSQWAPAWLADLRSGGALSRVGAVAAARVLDQGIRVLAALLAPDPSGRAGPCGRGELAERFTGTAHGLDDDTVLARLVLRGLARAHNRPFPADPRARRELWESADVWPDAVSTTVLTYALTSLDGGWLPAVLRSRADHAAETHLTMRDLRRIRWRLAPGTTVFVCENPRVVEAAAEAGCRRPMVCASGNPTHLVVTLLDALAEAGAAVTYRGDFDWPGVAIANRIISRYRARPWRMTTADYEQQVDRARARGTPLQPLSGQAVTAAWDPELTATMQALGVAVHEESALELLLDDLSA